MKSVPIRNFAGQAKLRGKLTKLLGCGCCEVQDFRWRERLKQADKERQALPAKHDPEGV